MKFPLFPEQASTVAERVDLLYFILTALTGFVALLIFLTITFFLFRYRDSKQADRTLPRLRTLPLEATWIVVPLILFLVVFTWGSVVYYEIEQVPEDAMEIYVVGKQWMWKLQHQTGNREINELHVPVGRKVKLTIASQDVIHSFFAPAFRIKQDAVPGRYTTAWFQATRTGVYHLFCTEYCGTDHSRMKGTIYVMEPAEFSAWLRAGEVSETLAAAGERLFRTVGCSGCHMGTGTVRAPQLEGLYGRPVALMSGEVVVADDQYIRDSILLPQSKIVAGFAPVMPSFQGRLSEEEIFQLVAYIKSLREP